MPYSSLLEITPVVPLANLAGICYVGSCATASMWNEMTQGSIGASVQQLIKQSCIIDLKTQGSVYLKNSIKNPDLFFNSNQTSAGEWS